VNDPNRIADLVGRARAGESRAYEELVRLHFRAAFSVALAVLGNPADAEDLAQDSFVVALQQLDRCRHPERFAGWLVQIVRNRGLNTLKSRRVAGAVAQQLGTEEATTSSIDGVGLRERLLQALECVTPEQREVVLLHDLDEWTHAEIGATLGISEVMSRQHLFQARKAMRAFVFPFAST
jgi:RNA polymerase sigma-70 factor (ECF subfamily)